MYEILFSIVLSLVSSACYDAIKKILTERKSIKRQAPAKLYSKEYIKSIKKEFYICFPIGIIFLFLSRANNGILSVFNSTMAFIMLFFALMAFMCSIEVINYFTNKNTDEDTR